MYTASHSQRAFTLIELVVVLLVVAIIAAAAAPRYAAAIARHQLDSAARRLAGDLQFARDEALRTSRTQRVTFSVGTSGYTMPTIADPRGASATYGVRLDAAPYQVEMPRAQFATSDAYVEFNLHGVPHASGDVRLQRGAVRAAVAVDRSGTITIGSW